MIIYKDQTVYLLNKINNTIIKNNYVKKNQRILISISGGQDSICMFFILFQLKKQWHWPFGIIFCNHLWQQNSFYTALLIIKLAYIFTIPIYYEIASNKIFSEHRSRNWRYSAFYRISFFYNYEIVTTGHTSSDKIETILFQLMRGTSTKNLTCLHFKKYFLSVNRFSRNNAIQTIYLYNNIKLKMPFVNKMKKASFYQLPKIITSDNPRFTKGKSFSLPVGFVSYNKAVASCKSKGRRVASLSLLNTQKLFHQNYLVIVLLKTNNEYDYDITEHFNTAYNEYKLYLLLKANKNYNLNTRFLIRPVLNLSRFDLKKLSLLWNLPLYPDKTNQTKHYYRNRIRKQLLPTLRFFFNPQIDTILLQFSEITTTEQLYFDVILNQLKYKFQFKKYKTSYLQTSLFYGVPLSIQRKLIKQFLENCVHKQTSFFHIEYMIQKISQNKKFYKLPFTSEASPKIITNNNLRFTFGKSLKLPVGFDQKVASLLQYDKILFCPTKNNVLQNKFYRNCVFLENYFLANLCFAVQNNAKNYLKNGFPMDETKNSAKAQFILLANNSMKNSVQIFSSLKHFQYFLPCKNNKNKYLFQNNIFINQNPLVYPTAFASKTSCRLVLLGKPKGRVFFKKNIFNFKKLTLPFGGEATCRVASLQKNAFFDKENFSLYQKKVNFFISAYCYFNKFEVLFFPEIGILLNFSKNIIFLQT